MRKYLLPLIILNILCLGALKPAKVRNKSTPVTGQEEPILVVLADSNATALSSTTSSWTHAESLAVEIPQGWGYVELSFYGYGDGDGAGSPDNGTFSFDIYTVDYRCGMTPVALANSGTIGAQQMSHTPHTGAELNSGAVSTNYCWADTLTEGTRYYGQTIHWPTSSSDGRITVDFDRKSALAIYVRIYSIASLTSVTCVMSGFN